MIRYQTQFISVHRLLQIGIVGNSFRKVRTVSQIVHRLLQIGIVGSRSWISTVAKSLSGGSPITSNRNSWKHSRRRRCNASNDIEFTDYFKSEQLKTNYTSGVPICLCDVYVHRLLQIGIVRNDIELRHGSSMNMLLSVHRLLQIGIVGNPIISPREKAWAEGTKSSPITSNRNSWKQHTPLSVLGLHDQPEFTDYFKSEQLETHRGLVRG